MHTGRDGNNNINVVFTAVIVTIVVISVVISVVLTAIVVIKVRFRNASDSEGKLVIAIMLLFKYNYVDNRQELN